MRTTDAFSVGFALELVRGVLGVFQYQWYIFSHLFILDEPDHCCAINSWLRQRFNQSPSDLVLRSQPDCLTRSSGKCR